MRKVLFVHNGPLYRDTAGNLFSTHFTETVKQRYLLLGDHVTLLMREALLDSEQKGMSALSSNNCSFVPVPELMSPMSRLKNHRAATETIRRAVQDSDIVVARIPSLVSRIAVKWARTYHRPYLVECVACNWDALRNHRLAARLSAPWYFLMQRAAVGRSPYVIYVTEEFLQRRYPANGRQVSLSNVQIEEMDPATLERRLQRIHASGNVARPVSLVTVADVGVPYKGQGDVISGLPMLESEGVDAEYHLIGGGDPTRLMRLAEKHDVGGRVRFHGPVEHSEVFDRLDELDIYIQPSRQEGLPRAVIEAMSRGMPVLGATTGGIPELLSPERLFGPGDQRGIVDAIERVVLAAEQEKDARRNFARAQDFLGSTLEARRQQFFSEFLRDHGFKPADASLGLAEG